MWQNKLLKGFPEDMQDFLKVDEIGNQKLIEDYLSGNVYPYDRLNEFMENAGFTSGFHLRDQYVARIGFVLYSTEVLLELSKLLRHKKVIEVGAGTGYLSKQLKKRHVQIKPVDRGNWYHNQRFIEPHYCHIYGAEAARYVKKNRHDAVVMSWPDYDKPFAFHVTKAMRKGSMLIFQGEGNGGCTGDEQFFDYLETNFEINEEKTQLLNEHHVQYDGIHDNWYVFKKTKNNKDAV